MRLPGGYNRRPRVGIVANAQTVSVVANVLLASVLVYLYFTSAGLPSTNGGVGDPTEVIINDMRSEISNVTGALANTIDTLQHLEAEQELQRAAADARLLEAQQRYTALQTETEGLRQQITSLQYTQSSTDKPTPVGGKLWLTIGIPTIPRRNQTDYLTRVLSTLMEELPLDETDPLYRRVKVIVMNNRPGNHSVWQALADRVANAAAEPGSQFVQKAAVYVDFVDSPGTVQDPTPDAAEPDDSHNPTNRPGRAVRRQTGDLIGLMELAAPLSHYYVFMEDDFRVCPGMLRILGYVVRKLNTIPSYSRWLALRFSYGMNGILLHSSDLNSMATYFRKHMARLPPDLLWTEWFKGRKPELRLALRGRKLAVYRYNLLDHIGAQSSFDSRAVRPEWPRCFHPMSEIWSLARTEQFNEKRCPLADISPCPGGDGGETWARYSVSWPMIRDGEDMDHPQVLPASPQHA